ncbi:hypothetical protein KO566_01105 [Flavobacteriaceae bacterium XHP0103]|uniref:hypothetical protein n=1 Tax=Marixanthotalea marina TaxID=2844359 RepID=UPI002989EA2D|nr:hypothetical protein [Marixanthotalea marina]MBU3820642.1 hypothetical protein [Marixanthotalea marina]
MSKESPQPQPSEEVDLGQLFKLIGNAFERFFKFIGGIFYKLFLAFVWFVFFIKKHILKLVIAGVIGIGFGFMLQKVSDPVYKSYVTIKQNYDTGENLYNSINYYNDLVKQKDYSTLENVLGIEASQAQSISEFDIQSVVNENDKLKEYDAYLKTLDTAVAKIITYEMFLKNDVEHVHKYQQITIKAKKRNNFKTMFDNIINNVESNDYFERERTKEINQLNRRKEVLGEALAQSDSLQTTYKKVLESNLPNNGSEIGITFEGNNEKDKTKEFDLYLNDIELRRELVDIERQIADKEQVIEIMSSKQESGSIDNKMNFFGVLVGVKLFYGLLLTSIAFLVLLALDFIKFLEKYKN